MAEMTPREWARMGARNPDDFDMEEGPAQRWLSPEQEKAARSAARSPDDLPDDLDGPSSQDGV